MRRRTVRLVAAGFVIMAVSGLVWSSFGLFLVELQAEFGWSRSEITGAFAAFALSNALAAPFLGYALRRWDSRLLLSLLSVLLGCALALATRVETAPQFWFAFGVLGGLGAQSVSSFVVFAILARRVRRRIATAMSVADAGSGFAALVGLPLIQHVIETAGWRAAYLGLGALVVVAGVALHGFVLEPVRRAASGPSERPAASPGRAAPAVLAPALAMAASYFCGAAAYHGLLTQQIALFDRAGVPPEAAVWAAATAGAVIFGWRLVSGWMCDAMGVIRVMALAAVAAALTFLGLGLALAGSGVGAFVIYPLALGVGFGGQQVLLAVALRRLVPPGSYSQHLGFGRLASGLGMAAGPVVGALAFDLSGASAAVGLTLGGLALAHLSMFALAFRLRARPARSRLSSGAG